jgi:2,3-bisphosphoglycerate-independent phosphoglycerate mutase
VKTDSDFYLHPGMRAKEVTAAVNAAIAAGTSRLICCNIAAPDMVGHLLPARYEEAKAAYMAAAEALVAIAESARMHGRSMVITSDHGNIEDDTSAHSVSDVLTTIILPYTRTGTGSTSTKATVGIPVFQARLFDIAPTLLRLLGLQPSGPETAEKAVATTGSTPAAHTFATTNSQEIPDYFAGKPLVVTG